VTIGDGALVAAQGGVPSDLDAGGRYLGTPARPILEAKRIFAAETRLPDLLQRVRALERAVEALGGSLERKGKRGE
jgi:UDP-3-O-[3-hydroxymyristoyl] glucosamine N-acyltransferase